MATDEQVQNFIAKIKTWDAHRLANYFAQQVGANSYGRHDQEIDILMAEITGRMEPKESTATVTYRYRVEILEDNLEGNKWLKATCGSRPIRDFDTAQEWAASYKRDGYTVRVVKNTTYVGATAEVVSE